MPYSLRKRKRAEEVIPEEEAKGDEEEDGDESDDSDSKSSSSDDDFVEDDSVESSSRKSLLEMLLENAHGHPDDDWTAGMTEDEIAKLKPVYEALQQKIIDENPTVPKILEASLTDSEKKRCLEMFDAMNSYAPGTGEYYGIRNEIIEILRKSEGSQNDSISDLEREEERLKTLLADNQSLKHKILTLRAPDSVKASLLGKYLRLERMDVSDALYSTLKDQIEWSINLPHSQRFDLKVARDSKAIGTFLSHVGKELDKRLYGMENVKETIILMLNDALSSEDAEKSVALCGPPGVGKTEIAKAFASSVGLPFEHISLGGARDSTMFYGSDNVYIGAGPGIIVRTLCNMKCSDGVILFDEIDKLGATPEGVEMQYALLHITDYLQNSNFRDKYLSDLKINISNLWFFYSLNSQDTLDKALRNRLWIIDVKPYAFNERLEIVEKYKLPAILKKVGMSSEDVVLTRDAIVRVMRSCPEEEGIRGVMKMIKSIVSKINLYRILGDVSVLGRKLSFSIKNFRLPMTVSAEDLDTLLDPPKSVTPSYIS